MIRSSWDLLIWKSHTGERCKFSDMKLFTQWRPACLLTKFQCQPDNVGSHVPQLFTEQAQLPISYLRKDHVEGWRHDALVPFEERSDSPVYVQSNCMPQIKRDNIVRNLMRFPDLNIRSFGRCG